MAQPVWQTQTNLGSFTSGSPLTILVIARPVTPATSVTYSISTGSLPTGLTLNSATGYITGTPVVASTSTITFGIVATDNLGNDTNKTFSMQVVYYPAQPQWNTPAGSIGSYPASVVAKYQLSASPIAPATSITYALISGTLPSGLTINSSGYISGTPSIVTSNTTSTFTIRVTDNLGNIRDRTFLMTVTGSAIPQFLTANGSILTTQDSLWIELPIAYSNPKSDNPVIVQVKEGTLPPGLEIDVLGIIRGYPNPPIVTITQPLVSATSTLTTSSNNTITVSSTTGFSVGRPVTFSGSVFGGVTAGTTYYVKSILNSTTFTITATQNGPTYILGDASGLMSVTLPSVSTGNPTIRTYTFTLELSSPLGNDLGIFSITVVNQNVPVSQGGPGKPNNSRLPVIYNTRPPTYNLNDTDPYYGYYLLPPVAPTQYANLGSFQSGEYFAFKMIGHDFDGNPIKYLYANLPTGLTGDVNTGWITGVPTLNSTGLSNYNFSVRVYKSEATQYASPFYNYSFTLQNNVTGNIVWVTDSDLGQILNGNISTLFVRANSDVDLNYRLTSGSLPPNLSIASNGEITGRVADQPADTYLEEGAISSYTFTVQAYATSYPSIISSKTFTVNVLQEFAQPTDTLYIKAAPPVNDRRILQELLGSETIIPTDALYRPNDQYFGKATSVIYEHAYGIYSSDIQEYLAAVIRNHYWRNITLGELKTAIARNSAGEVIYEVVYSEVIDNLVNPQGVSINSQIYWPRPIDLGLGPWYTSNTEIFTSWEEQLGQLYYTSLTPGYARVLYPNSLYNMRNRVADVLGQEYDSRLLPLWMTSQQSNGSTLGYTQAWVICYTKPGFANTIKNNIETLWKDPTGNVYTLNLINFQIDRFSVDKSITYNYDNNTDPAAWTSLPSATPAPDPLNSKDFYVLFPRQTILPDQSQY
jgi:hypothetical protein